MYTYINTFSISIFLMSLYTLYASWSINKTKRNAILLGMLVTIISSKILYLLINEKVINLNYTYEIIIILLIIQISIKGNQSKISRILITINYILGSISLVMTMIISLNVYNTIITGYMLMTTLYLNFIIMDQKKINKKDIIVVNLIYFYLFISLLINKNESIITINNILDGISSIYIFLKIFKENIIDASNRKEKIRNELSISNTTINIHNEKLKINKNITSTIKESLYKKQSLLQIIEAEYNRCTFIIDREGHILNEDNSFSKMWKEYSQYKYKINLNTFLDDSIKNANYFLESINKVNQEGIEVHAELRGKNDEFFECTYAPFIINNKNIGVICSMVDITYKKNSEIKIKENNTKYRKIVDNIPYSILITDENNILYNNDKNNEIDFYNEDVKNIIVDTSTSGELYYTCENENEVCLNIDRVSFDDGESEKDLVVIRDITNHKKILKDVEYSKEKYESLVNVIPEGIYISNYENKLITYSNQIFSELIGTTTLEEVKSNYIDENMVITLGKNNDNVKFTRKVITNKHGQEINIECGAMLIEVNKRLKIVGVIRDITEQVKAENIEREIEIKKKENKIKTEFFVNISHELKTPLNVISSSNQLLEVMNKDYIKKNPSSEISKAVKIVNKHSYMLMGLINNIMDLAKLESQFHESKMDYYNIISVVEDVCEQFNKYIKVNNIEILFDTDEEERIANVDPDDIEKIVLTLLSVVIRYSYPDSIISVDLSSVKNKTVITIKNQGGYDYNRYINDQGRRSLDIGVTVAKSMIELYKGNIDIKAGSKKDIEINVEIEVNEEIDNYKKRVKLNGDDFIYTEYMRMCNY